uniref:Uncharacterized protein n=1 Tax=Rhipicephalus zambeziensis TaxID=60191 RepID=A0A224Y534_9ACAR
MSHLITEVPTFYCDNCLNTGGNDNSACSNVIAFARSVLPSLGALIESFDFASCRDSKKYDRRELLEKARVGFMVYMYVCACVRLFVGYASSWLWRERGYTAVLPVGREFFPSCLPWRPTEIYGWRCVLEVRQYHQRPREGAHFCIVRQDSPGCAIVNDERRRCHHVLVKRGRAIGGLFPTSAPLIVRCSGRRTPRTAVKVSLSSVGFSY